MKEQTLLEAATDILLNKSSLTEAKDPKAKLFGLFAKSFGGDAYILYAIGNFIPNDKGNLSSDDYKTLWAIAQKRGASRGNDWHDSPQNMELKPSKVKEYIEKYKKEVELKTSLIKDFEKQLKAAQ
jgi:hypothetical protein